MPGENKNIPVHGPGGQPVGPKTANPSQQVNPPQHPQQNRAPGQQPNIAPARPAGPDEKQPVAPPTPEAPVQSPDSNAARPVTAPSQDATGPKADPARAPRERVTSPVDVRPVTKPKTIRVGETYNVVAPEHTGGDLHEGRQKGRIVAITGEPGKQVGVEFKDPIGVHSCDGNGRDGHCLWVRFDQLLDDDEYKAHTAEKGRQQAPAQVELFDELVVEPDGKGGFSTRMVKGNGGLGPNHEAPPQG